jgi:hypothetical protein
MRRNQIADLLQNRVRMPCWNVGMSFFHPCRVAGFDNPFQPFLSTPVGR